MARKFRTLISLIRLDLRGEDEAHVHFHRGPAGRPAVCHDPRCEMPRLSVQ